MELKANERIDYVNDDLSLIQNDEGLTFGTDALLLAGYIKGGYKRGVELGSGSGIISMLLLTRGKVDTCDCLEIQEEYAALTERNAHLNRLDSRLRTFCVDIRDHKPDSECDIVYTNPPYMKADSGKANLSDKKNIARHEVNGDINEFCRSASRMLKFGGSLVIVYRPDRLCDLICAMRDSGVEPKRMTLTFADTASVPSMVLVEGKKGGKSSLKLTRPLVIYTDTTHKSYSDDMNYIMENGVFPKEYYT